MDGYYRYYRKGELLKLNPATLTMIPMDIKRELDNFDFYMRMGTDEEERPKAQSSRVVYRLTAKMFLEYCENKVPTPDLAKEWLRCMEENGCSPNTINRNIWALKSYFRFKAGGDDHGPKLRLRGLKVDKKIPRYLDPDEWNRLVAEAAHPFRDKNLPSHARLRAKLELALIWVYCGGGLRVSEGVNLKIEDIDKKGYLKVHRKGGNEGYVPVENIVIKALLDYIASRPSNGPYVFPGKMPGTHLSRRQAEAIVTKLCKRAGLPDVHVHSLRHTAGADLRTRGAEERDIQEVLGHKNISTTQIYTHIAREILKKKLPTRFADMGQGKLL